MGQFKIQFTKQQLNRLAKSYDYPNDKVIEKTIGPRAKKRGFFLKEEFQELCKWKTPRSKSRVKKNPPTLIEETTRIALSTSSEELRIGVLTLLRGVSYPTASVVLHFAHRSRYPILDYRALWSVGIDPIPADYTFDFWWEYTKYCRKAAREWKCSMRTLDRALWQYSKENQ